MCSAPIGYIGTINQVWAYDFVFDTCADGRTFKCLTVIDELTRKSRHRRRGERSVPRHVPLGDGNAYEVRVEDYYQGLNWLRRILLEEYLKPMGIGQVEPRDGWAILSIA